MEDCAQVPVPPDPSLSGPVQPPKPFSKVEVLVGNLKDSYVVTGGLKVGDQIVLEGIAALRNDTEIKPKLSEIGPLSENMSTEKPLKN